MRGRDHGHGTGAVGGVKLEAVAGLAHRLINDNVYYVKSRTRAPGARSWAATASTAFIVLGKATASRLTIRACTPVPLGNVRPRSGASSCGQRGPKGIEQARSLDGRRQ